MKYSKGDRVLWSYRHTTSRTTRFWRHKHGTIERPHKEKGILSGLYWVKFDGNKTLSLVPGTSLHPLTQPKAEKVGGR